MSMSTSDMTKVKKLVTSSNYLTTVNNNTDINGIVTPAGCVLCNPTAFLTDQARSVGHNKIIREVSKIIDFKNAQVADFITSAQYGAPAALNSFGGSFGNQRTVTRICSCVPSVLSPGVNLVRYNTYQRLRLY